MQIVIDISDDLKDKICNSTEEWATRYVEGWNLEIARIIRNGTPLPKGHGRLIDADKVAEEIEEYRMGTDKLSYADLSNAENFNCGIDNALSDIKDAPTIIEADRGKEE